MTKMVDAICGVLVIVFIILPLAIYAAIGWLLHGDNLRD